MMSQSLQLLVAIDIGNSHLSAALFVLNEAGEPLPAVLDVPVQVRWCHQEFSAAHWYSTVECWASQGDLRWFVSSVHRPARESLLHWLAEQRSEESVHVLTFQDLPLSIEVASPERVGMDRLVAAVAVNQLRSPKHPALVVDCGSAITCDLVSADGVFQGGAIMPGWRLATHALAEETDQLPEVAWTSSPVEVVGKSTEGAISSGVYWGTLGALRELVSQMSQSLTEAPEKFFTGAGSIWSEWLAEEQFREESDLVLTGVALSGAHLIRRERLQKNG